HIPDDTEINGRKPADRANTHDRAGFRMGRGYGDSKQTGIQQAERAGKIRGKSLIPLQFYHIHADGFNDLFSADAGSKSHNHTAEQHQPYRNLHSRNIALSIGERNSKEQNTNKFLTVLGAVHKAHRRSSDNLGSAEKAVRLPSIHTLADNGDSFADHPAGGKAKKQAQHKTVQHLYP